MICDGPVHQSRRPQIVFGARGVETLDITVYGPRRELHSGHYGNWAPNPALMLAKLLASMKDDTGRVLVDHFYDGITPLSETEKRAIAEAPNVDADLKRELWLGETEGGGKSLVELLNQPSLNIRGMASARTGAQASNVIPSKAYATIDMRLVKGIDHRAAFQRVVEHIRKQGYFVVDHDPDPDTLMAHPKVAKVTNTESGYNAERTSMDLPISRDVIAHRRSCPRTHHQAAHHGRKRAALHDLGNPAYAHHYDVPSPTTTTASTASTRTSACKISGTASNSWRLCSTASSARGRTTSTRL